MATEDIATATVDTVPVTVDPPPVIVDPATATVHPASASVAVHPPPVTVDPAPATGDPDSVTVDPPPVTVDPAPIRGKKVEDVTLGRQAPRPAHEMGSINQTPDRKSIPIEDILKTAPADFRFPTTNQTRHCFTRYIEYHKCIQAKGEGANECDKFAKYYRSLCPTEWVVRWNEQRELGIFPGPL
ncbi:hypothetical protein SUGI_0791320 [Cryptomeria japonica]|nr:hypothetical protein SUGI_0791320 [Cryptomeria japonica]